MCIKKTTILRIIKLIFCLSLLFSNVIMAQSEFFNSKINFSDKQLNNFHSSFSIDSSQVYFNANDYYLYVYDKKSGVLNWSYQTANKSNSTPKLNQNSVFIGDHISEYDDKCLQLNIKTGDTIQHLKIEALNTQPFFKGDLLFCTAISPGIGGAVLAYNLKTNSIVWQKFIAHGVSAQPYYLKDKIIANAEADNWFEVNYIGQLLDTTCKQKTNLFVEDIKCVRNFKHLTHNQKELSNSYFNESENLIIKYTKDKTIVLGENKMLIINSNNKIEIEIKLQEILKFTENQVSNYKEILKAEENTVWFFSYNILTVYDFENNKTLQTFDFNQWNPHQTVLDGNNLWLISRNDGELLGLELNDDKKEADLMEVKIDMQRKINNHKPDLKKIEAAKAAESKFKK